MIWLFKIDEVFWNDKPKVNEYYSFDTNDIEFDISQYDVSIYFGLASYYLLDDSNDTKVYNLRLISSLNEDMIRILVSENSKIYNIIRNFYERSIKPTDTEG